MITFLFIYGSSNSKLSNNRSNSFIKKKNIEKQARYYSTNNKNKSKYLNP